MDEHTPSPWNWLNYPDGRKLLTGPNNAVIHCPGPGPQMECTKADQALIAAAPDLLDVCENLLIAMALQPHVSTQPDWLREMLKPVRAAVAKAEKR